MPTIQQPHFWRGRQHPRRSGDVPVAVSTRGVHAALSHTPAADRSLPAHIPVVAATSPSPFVPVTSPPLPPQSPCVSARDVLAALEDARRTGVLPSKTIDEAQKITGDTAPRPGREGTESNEIADLFIYIYRQMLLRNFEIAERAALFTDDNLALMRRGSSPHIPG